MIVWSDAVCPIRKPANCEHWPKILPELVALFEADAHRECGGAPFL